MKEKYFSSSDHTRTKDKKGTELYLDNFVALSKLPHFLHSI